MGDGSLTFAVPVRDPRGVSDWQEAMRFLRSTVGSMLAQDGPRPRVVLGVSPGTELPDLPGDVVVVPVDLPYHALPEGEGEARWDAIRADKGLRLAHALAAVRPRGHVMVVDYDDFVSTRLARHVAEHPDQPGWFVDSGYLWDGGGVASALRTRFNEACGTSLIVRADLLRIPADPSDPAHLDWIKAILGSHKMWQDVLPLEPLPFPGAVYRVGSGHNVSGAISVARRLVRSRHRFGDVVDAVGGLRPWGSVRRQFGA
ncbi:MAG: hypothetical protein KDB60_18810 [Propionibacteriaceae bacterium]|nr:hypothetical protein [Propionibacteriaceae bacterium]